MKKVVVVARNKFGEAFEEIHQSEVDLTITTLLVPELIGPSLISFDRRMIDFLMSTLNGSQKTIQTQLIDVRDVAKIVIRRVQWDHAIEESYMG